MPVILASAGFRDDTEAADAKGHSEMAVAWAIAYAESRFFPTATNRSSAGVANGLFQIMQPSVNPALLDGQTNANQAFRMYKEGGSRFFGPWAGSAWQPHIGTAELSVKAWHDSGNMGFREKVGEIADSIPNPLSGVDAIADFIGKLFQPGTWIRVLLILAGLVLGFVALNSLMKQFGISVPLPYGASLGK
jgi:hypothetical protein